MKKIISVIVILFGIMVMGINVDAKEKEDYIVTDKIIEDGFIEEIDDNEIALQSNSIVINWSVSPKTIKKTKGFVKEPGQKI